jgi:hypothetical protein
MGMPAPRRLSAVRFVVIGGPKKLGLLARELAAYRLGDPHNMRVERLGSLGPLSLTGRSSWWCSSCAMIARPSGGRLLKESWL